MPPPPVLARALPKILSHFKSSRQRVYRYEELRAILDRHRSKWKLPPSTRFTPFLEALFEEGTLRLVELPFPSRHETRYVWGKVPPVRLAASLKPTSYLSHYTAMVLHELTPQEPKTIYINVEQRPQASNPDSLTQQSIDNAFKRSQRVTRNICEYEGHRLIMINGKHTAMLGVVSIKLDSEEARVTGLERTLIDIAVRPAYSGGVSEVAHAYRTALSRVSIKTLVSMLGKMDYVYPYQQVIGYYLERAGAQPSALEPLRAQISAFDFYLTYQMPSPEYVSKWKLFIPKGF